MPNLPIVLAAAGMLAPLAPALPDWELTHWGMTPAEVVASVPDTKAVKHRKRDDHAEYHMLAAGSYHDNGFDFRAEFFFDPGDQRLAMIRLTLKTPRKCAEWETTLPISSDSKPSGIHFGGGGDVDVGMLEWVDAGSGNRLSYTQVSAIIAKRRRYTMCSLTLEQPA